MNFEQRFPLFEEGRILKKEALDRIRDDTADTMALLYKNYGNGIIEGFEIQGCQEGILVGGGILKDEEVFFIMKEPAKLNLSPDNQVMLVVLRRINRRCDHDFITQIYSLDLIGQRELGPGEYELGRFRLEKGAELRTAEDYKDIHDVQTEYNTLNLVHVKASCEGGNCLPSVLFRIYARDILTSAAATPLDLAFAMTCLGSGRVSRACILAYLAAKCPGMDERNLGDNEFCYQQLKHLHAGFMQKRSVSQSYESRSKKTIID